MVVLHCCLDTGCITNSLCFLKVKRSKLLEEERRMLLTGLQAVDKAKDWYESLFADRVENSDITLLAC